MYYTTNKILTLLCILFHLNIDVQNYSECLGSLKIRKKKTKILYEISKCAINMCVVVLLFRRKILAMKIWLLLLSKNNEYYFVVQITCCLLINDLIILTVTIFSLAYSIFGTLKKGTFPYYY